MMHRIFVFKNLSWNNRNNIDQFYAFFDDFFNKFEFDAVLNIMLVFITSITFHFKKIYEIFIFKFFNLFVRSFVCLISFFTIFASFFFISRYVSIYRTLHIVIFTDVIDIWLSIRKCIFSNSARIRITNFFFIEKSLYVLESSNQFF